MSFFSINKRFLAILKNPGIIILNFFVQNYRRYATLDYNRKCKDVKQRLESRKKHEQIN